MQINLSGHHVEITDGIREAVQSKFSKIESHYPTLDTLTVIVTVERNEQSVEAKTQFLGASISVLGSNHDMYSAIADAAKKMDAALSHRKGTSGAHKHAKPMTD